jgi:sugar (pentulose or hexulose) kinase
MYVLGIDVGTTGTKALLVDSSGLVVARGYSGYGLVTPGEGRVEQDAKLWWTATIAAVRQACAGLGENAARDVVALSLSTQGASSLLVDGRGEPLGPALTWMDGRASVEAEELASALGAECIYRKSGWRVGPSLDAAKIMWLRKHEGDSLARAGKFLSTLEFINQRLVGIPCIDPTNAAIRQLMDIGTGHWDPAILEASGCELWLLPEIVSSGDFIGTLLPAAAEALGLGEVVRVYNGAHDQYCSCLGSSITTPGEIMLSTGTAWVLLAVTERPLFTESWINPGPHVIKGRFGALTALPTSGAALEWFRSRFLGVSYEELASHVERAEGSSGEVLYFPWLVGGGFPRRLPTARAAFLGLGLEHDRYDAARAVMEGVVFQMRLALEEYRAQGCPVETLRLMGGALNSPYWTGLIRDNVEGQVEVMEETDSACVGAAAFAAVGAGFFSDWRSAALAMNTPRAMEAGGEAERQAATRKFEAWRRAGEALSALYQSEGAGNSGGK